MRIRLSRTFLFAFNNYYTSTAANNRSLKVHHKTVKGIRAMSGESTIAIGRPLSEVIKELNNFADISLAESWDNVGLLIEPATETLIKKILLTNDLTECVMQEAITKDINLIISYHPPIFAALKRITNTSWKERIVASCLENRIAVFSPHTSWDAVYGGVNDWLADAFSMYILPDGRQPLTSSSSNHDALYIATVIGSCGSLDKITKEVNCMKMSERSKWDGKEMCTVICTEQVLKELKSIDGVNVGVVECGKKAKPQVGMGRLLQVSGLTLSKCVNLIKEHLGLSHIRLAYAKDKNGECEVKRIALVPGSGGSLLKGVQADLFLTGEMFHHDVLEANHNGASVILTNHSDSERGFLTQMEPLLKNTFQNNIKIIISACDSDPLKTV